VVESIADDIPASFDFAGDAEEEDDSVIEQLSDQNVPNAVENDEENISDYVKVSDDAQEIQKDDAVKDTEEKENKSAKNFKNEDPKADKEAMKQVYK
jgi:hypothetical protein